MRFAIATLILPVLALAGPVVSRDDKSIIAAINNINSKLTILNNTVTTFKGDTGTALGIQGKQNDLDNAIKNADQVAKASKPLNEDQSGAVATVVIGLANNAQSVLANIVRHKPQFQKAILGLFSADFLVEADLKNLKADTDQFAKDLVAKLTATYQGVAPSIIGPLDDAFNRAIAAFAS